MDSILEKNMGLYISLMFGLGCGALASYILSTSVWIPVGFILGLLIGLSLREND